MPAQLICGDINQLPPDELRNALKESGLTRIDTSARYQNGESEKIIGRAKLPQDFAIDTKVLVTGFGEPHQHPDAIEKSVSNSLRVLGVNKVNVLYSHAPDHVTPIAEQVRGFNAQYKKGRFNHLGLSNMSPMMLREWLEIADKEGYVKPSVYQGQYNLLCRGYEDTLFPLLRENGIHFAAFSPLAGGFLLGNFTAEGIQGGKRFGGTPFNKWYDHPSMHEAIQNFKSISERTGLDLDELALRWEKYHSALEDNDVILLGGSKITHIRSSAQKANKGPLPADVAQELNDIWKGCRDDGMAITAHE